MSDEAAMRADAWLNANLGGIFPTLFGLLALGPLLLLYQAYQWLRVGYWTPITLASVGAPAPRTSWVGLQRMLGNIMGWEIAFILLGISMLVMFLALGWMDRVGERARYAQRNIAERDRAEREAEADAGAGL